MDDACFESPLSDGQLKELGRLVVNFGFVEFLLGQHVGMLLDITPNARIDLINPLSTHRKSEILRQGLKRIPKDETRKMLGEACDLINDAIKSRNTMLHGIWGFDGEEPDSNPIAVSTKDRSTRLHAEEIGRCADLLALASQKLMNAILIDSGRASSGGPDRLIIK